MCNRHLPNVQALFMRTLFTLACLGSSVLLAAQSTTSDHRLHVDGSLDPLTAKLVHQVVNDLDPKGRVAIDGNLIKARLNSEITTDELLATLNELNAGNFDTGWPIPEADPETGPTNVNGSGEVPGNPSSATDVPRPLDPSIGQPGPDLLNGPIDATPK